MIILQINSKKKSTLNQLSLIGKKNAASNKTIQLVERELRLRESLRQRTSYRWLIMEKVFFASLSFPRTTVVIVMIIIQFSVPYGGSFNSPTVDSS